MTADKHSEDQSPCVLSRSYSSPIHVSTTVQRSLENG